MLDPRRLRRSPDGRRAPERPPLEMTAVRLCDRNGCTEAATWRVAVHIYPPEGHPMAATPITGLSRLAVCETHKAGVALQDVLSSDGARRILDLLSRSGLDKPDMSRTELAFEPYRRMPHERA